MRFCNNTDVDIKNEIRDDFLSIIILHCSNCKVDYPVCSEEPELDLMNVNLAFVAGIVSLGLSLHQLNDICSSLRIPNISALSYENYLNQIYDIYNQSLEENKHNTTCIQRPLQSSTPKLKEVVDYETKKQKFLESLQLSPSEIQQLSVLTVNQRHAPLWHQERKKRLTASNFGRICKLLESTDRGKTAKDIFSSNFTGNIYTKYGTDNEINAIHDFEKVLGKSVTACGLFVHPDYPYLAASPDGLIDDDAIIEIKCPYKARNMCPEDAITQKLIQFATFDNGTFRLKRTDKYYFQLQGQLFVSGKHDCYFIVWTKFGLLYEKITRDVEFWNEMFPKLKTFYFESLLPVILK